MSWVRPFPCDRSPCAEQHRGLTSRHVLRSVESLGCLGRSRRTDTVDAMVVAEAVTRVTSDPSDLGALAASEPAVTMHPVAKLPTSRY